MAGRLPWSWFAAYAQTKLAAHSAKQTKHSVRAVKHHWHPMHQGQGATLKPFSCFAEARRCVIWLTSFNPEQSPAPTCCSPSPDSTEVIDQAISPKV